ncbi:hypothetical protein HMPREF3227_01181 [Corynebacterium sp. CMW7794]|nr:hypothetical protein HMPREF3227_01181 [Corynebacterium sp. CMW7794]
MLAGGVNIPVITAKFGEVISKQRTHPHLCSQRRYELFFELTWSIFVDEREQSAFGMY